MSRVIVSSVILSAIAFSSLHAGSFEWGTAASPFALASKQSIEVITNQNDNQKLRLKSKSYELSNKKKRDSIFVPFDSDNLSSSAFARIEKARFHSKEFEDSVGKAASFETPQHEVWLLPDEFSFLQQAKHTGSFSLAFRVRPYQLKPNMEFLRKMTMFEGRRQGFRAIIDEGKLRFIFKNFFWIEENSLKTLELSSRNTFNTDQFYFVVLQFNDARGDLTLYINGTEHDRVYVTKDFSPDATQFLPRFHRWDKAPLIIGRGFLGALDELLLANFLIDADDDVGSFGKLERLGNRFMPDPGIVYSEVFSVEYSRSKLLSFEPEVKTPRGTDVKFFLRSSDKPFTSSKSERELPFKAVDESNLPKGKHFQWKAKLYSDGQGEYTPVIEAMRISYQENPPPQRPRSLEVAKIEDEAVVLRFRRNAEMDVINKGRYHVYYGVEKNEPLGVLRFDSAEKQGNGWKLDYITDKNNQLKTDDLRYQNLIQVRVTNQMIQENLLYARENPRLNYPYPLLQEDVPFYFWVTAADSAWSEDPHHYDHESKPSKPVVARP